MTFSIVIPLYNASKTVEKALESCTAQTFLPLEVIVVDDCSTDDSLDVVKKWEKAYKGSVHIIVEQLANNSGPSTARNRGWELSSGEYIAFLDADDWFLPNKLERMQSILKIHREIILLGHAYALEDAEVQLSRKLTSVSVKQVLMKNLSATPAIVVKREIVERFDETMRYTEDHDLWLRITQKYAQTYFLDEVLTIIGRAVRSEGGQSANLWAMRKGEIEMYRKYCKGEGKMFLFPFFALYSLGKHLVKKLL